MFFSSVSINSIVLNSIQVYRPIRLSKAVKQLLQVKLIMAKLAKAVAAH